MSGYDSKSAGRLLASIPSREAMSQEGHQSVIPGLIDYRKGWARLSDYAASLLHQFIWNESAPPEMDLDELRAKIAERQSFGEDVSQLVRTAQEMIATRRFAGEMNNKYSKPVLVTVGPARRGRCELCGGRIESGKAWYKRGKVWCPEHPLEMLAA